MQAFIRKYPFLTVAIWTAVTFMAGYRYGWAAGWVHAIEWAGALK